MYIYLYFGSWQTNLTYDHKGILLKLITCVFTAEGISDI